MNKQEMIEQIRSRNRSASVEFLVHFDEQALTSYLNRLTRINGRRGRDSVWVREGDSPAVVTRTPLAA